MAHTTSHPFVYDCETCNGVACYDTGRQQWRHQDRRSTCPELAVVAVALTQLALVSVRVDKVELAA